MAFGSGAAHLHSYVHLLKVKLLVALWNFDLFYFKKNWMIWEGQKSLTFKVNKNFDHEDPPHSS